jgi:hypothetical protein
VSDNYKLEDINSNHEEHGTKAGSKVRKIDNFRSKWQEINLLRSIHVIGIYTFNFMRTVCHYYSQLLKNCHSLVSYSLALNKHITWSLMYFVTDQILF